MSKDIRRKVRGSWWYGWVRFTFTSYDGSEQEGRRTTVWEFATAGQAKRAAESLAGSLASSFSVSKDQRKYHSKTEKRPSPFTIVEIGASRSGEE